MAFVSKILRLQMYLLAAFAVYVGLMFTLSVPSLQRHYLFLHKISVPMWPSYEAPHKHGIPEGQARNLRLTTRDGVEIGTWHHLPDSMYSKHADLLSRNETQLADKVFDEALATYPTFVYLHGNALNRAAPFRVLSYKLLSGVQDANVVAIDYRGFGDSDSFPTEDGVVQDARAAVDFVLERARGAKGKSPGITLIGQSLGTGIATQCALQMYRDGVHLDGLVLFAAFSSIRPMVAAFRMGGVVPMLGWLNYVPFKDELLDRLVLYKFDTDGAVRELLEGNLRDDGVRPPAIIVLHADNDDVIPVSHADVLMNTAVDTLHAGEKGSPFHVWNSNLPDIGNAHTIMRKTQTRPDNLPRLPNERVNLARGAPFSLIRLTVGGHNRLFDQNADLVRLMLPNNMNGKELKSPTAILDTAEESL